MRNLYIVAGSQPPNRNSEINGVPESVLGQFELQFSLLESIALKEKCTGFFCDGQDEEDADSWESILEDYLKDESGFIKQLKEKQENLSVCEKLQLIFELRELYMMRNIRQNGLLIRYFPTDLKFNPNITRTIEERDYIIFQNILKYGEDNNILFIGYNHKLEEFAKKEHDFNFCRVNIPTYYQEAIMVENLPERLYPLFDEYQKNKGFLVFVKNREKVRFLSELI